MVEENKLDVLLKNLLTQQDNKEENQKIIDMLDLLALGDMLKKKLKSNKLIEKSSFCNKKSRKKNR